MRFAFAVSGVVFTLCAGVVTWYPLTAHGQRSQFALPLASLSTAISLFLTLVFAQLDWARSLGAIVAWAALQLVILMGAANVPWPTAWALLLQTIQLNSVPIVGIGLLALRTTRVLTVALLPALALLIVLTTGVVLLLGLIGLPVEGTPEVSGVVLGAVVTVIGIVVVVWRIRRGLTQRFVAAWLSATGALAFIALLTTNAGWAPLLGVGVNGSFVLLWWVIFRRFLRLRSDGHMPDEVLHFSGCLFVVLVWIGAQTSPAGFKVLWLLIPFAAYAITLWTLLHGRRTREARGHTPALRFLLWRVFHQTPKDSWLIDTLENSWRRVGRLDLTVGLDLAMRSVNALALENFFRGRARRHFLSSAAEVRERLTGLPQGLALDGRYPLNELHCLLDTWELVVDALVREARVVLMDLRGLSQSNTGALRELSMVLPWAPLNRIIILSDRTTDERLLTEGIRNAWAHVPAGAPNFHQSHGTLRLLRCSGSRRVDARAVDRAVFDAVSGESPVQESVLTNVDVMEHPRIMRKTLVGAAVIAVIAIIAFVVLRAPTPETREALGKRIGPIVEPPPVVSPPAPASEPLTVASQPEPPPSLHIEIVIDTSEEMNRAFEGKTKLAAAVAALHPMPYFENDNLALRSFGGECRKDDSSQLVVQFGRKIQKQIEASTARLQPRGHPSISTGIAAAITDLESLRDAPRRIVVLTGGEFCPDEDFSEIKLRLKAAKLEPTELDIHVIGVGLSGDNEQKLGALVSDMGGFISGVKTEAELNRRVQWALELNPSAKPLLKDIYSIVDALNGTNATLGEVKDSLNARSFDRAPLAANAAQTSIEKTKEVFAVKHRSSPTYQLYWKTAMERRSSHARLLEIGLELIRYGQMPGGPDRPPTVNQWNDAIGRFMNMQFTHNAIVEQLEVIAEKARQEARRKPSVADRPR